VNRIAFHLVCTAGVVGLLTPALATEQVYHPVSPALGGSPNNGAFLLSTAQSQGEGVKSGNQGPDLSGLTNALSGIGGNTGNGNNGTGGNGGSGGGSGGSSGSGAANALANPTGRHHPMP
jgi:curli production assembly/transport component CsgF